MAEFLNRPRIVEEIVNVINSAKREIVMVVPYIKISPTIWFELTKPENLAKEVLLVYREDSMVGSEREKLHSLDNLTIMNHPNVHAKCYLNESSMIVCSMNLYEYSEKNNREMGVLLKSGSAYDDGIKEVRTIIQASKLEKRSLKMKEQQSFSFRIFDGRGEWLENYRKIVNKIFVHKRFETLITANIHT